MEVRLLGAVEAWAPEGQIDLGPRQQRFLLAILALNVNQLVTVDRLVDLTWSDAPPATARHSIHVRISQLRAKLAEAGSDRHAVHIITRGSTYGLRSDPMRIDAHRFRALLSGARAQSDDAERVCLLRRALDLWQGPPLADVVTQPARQLTRGLEEARLAAFEEWLDAELRLGRHGAVIDELTEYVAQHPFRQRLVAQLMLALYRAGRAAEALAAYRQARSRLADEFGLDPEPHLRDLETAILCTDPALDAPGKADEPVAAWPAVRPPLPGPHRGVTGAATPVTPRR